MKLSKIAIFCVISSIIAFTASEQAEARRRRYTYVAPPPPPPPPTVTYESGCNVAVGDLVYVQVSIQMVAALNEADCNALRTSTGTPMFANQPNRDYILNARDITVSDLVTATDYGYEGVRQTGYYPGVSYQAALSVLSVIDVYNSIYGGSYGFYGLLVKGTWIP